VSKNVLYGNTAISWIISVYLQIKTPKYFFRGGKEEEKEEREEERKKKKIRRNKEKRGII